MRRAIDLSAFFPLSLSCPILSQIKTGKTSLFLMSLSGAADRARSVIEMSLFGSVPEISGDETLVDIFRSPLSRAHGGIDKKLARCTLFVGEYNGRN